MLCLLSIIALMATKIAAHNQDESHSQNTNYTQSTFDAVNVDVYYESLCPDSVQFYTEQLMPTVNHIGQHINLRIFPYGKAKTREKNGELRFKCQHGPAECYGNKLHACSIDQLEQAEYLEFIFCLMSYNSDDATVNRCSILNNVDGKNIIKCANGAKGDQLLKYYGQETKKVSFTYVPHVTINLVPLGRTESFQGAVCAALSYKPEHCSSFRKI